MDYETKPTSRDDLRRFAAYLRKIFEIPPNGPFPVLEVLDKLSDKFEGSNYIIVEDKDLPPKTMAQCEKNNMGGFTIVIKESVYKGAYERGVGAFLGFICHEICHVFLFEIGFTPIYSRSFEDGEIPAYRSVEWQAKALCAEVMIPYEESIGMKIIHIQEKYHVSKAFASNRKKLERKEKENVKMNKKTYWKTAATVRQYASHIGNVIYKSYTIIMIAFPSFIVNLY